MKSSLLLTNDVVRCTKIMANSLELLAYSILNVAYAALLTVSTILLYDLLWAFDNEGYTLEVKDWIFVVVYWLPTAIGVLLWTIAFPLILFQMPLHEYNAIHLDMMLWVTWNVLTCGRSDSPNGTAINRFCNEISENMVMIIINVITTYLVFVVCFIVLIPILVIFMLYHNAKGVVTIGLSIQFITVILNTVVQIFLLDQYGYYSLTIVLCGMFFIIFGVATLGIRGALNIESSTHFLWIILEVLLLITMLTITFVVEYNENMYIEYVHSRFG